jgi:hypothetical protein
VSCLELCRGCCSQRSEEACWCCVEESLLHKDLLQSGDVTTGAADNEGAGEGGRKSKERKRKYEQENESRCEAESSDVHNGGMSLL